MFITKIELKYKIVPIFLISTYGSSAGNAPIFIRNKKVANTIQKLTIRIEENFVENSNLYRGRIKNTLTEAANARTPAVFLGSERRMAYDGRKYHSGWMCTGVCIGLAGTLFTESPKI